MDEPYPAEPPLPPADRRHVSFSLPGGQPRAAAGSTPLPISRDRPGMLPGEAVTRFVQSSSARPGLEKQPRRPAPFGIPPQRLTHRGLSPSPALPNSSLLDVTV
ncbi:hypothetical protein VPH35_002995 [Triticum aestivum]